MGSLDDLPQRTESHEIDEAAEGALRNAIEREKLFLVQRIDRRDYGSDTQLEILLDGDPTNVRVHGQLKGTRRETNGDGSVSVQVLRTNLNYLLGQPSSVFVCHHLPSGRLLVRYAEDVYAQYAEEGDGWLSQETITVRFSKPFDRESQMRLAEQVMAKWAGDRDRRLEWAVTPPEEFARVVSRLPPSIDVPTDPGAASIALAALYTSGKDGVISASFGAFAAVLRDRDEALFPAYMAEINRGLNSVEFDAVRVKEALLVIARLRTRGGIEPTSLDYCTGNAWLALGDYTKAVEVYRAALPALQAIDAGTAAKCAKNLGSALEQLGHQDEARDEYEHALKLDPSLGEANMALGMWRRRSGDVKGALALLDKVTPSRRSAVKMHNVSGWRIELLFQNGENDAAFREIFSLLGFANDEDWILGWCAQQVAKYGRTSPDSTTKALRFWELYLNERPSALSAKRQRVLCLERLDRLGLTKGVDFRSFKRDVAELVEARDSISALLLDLVGHWAQREENWTEAETAFRQAYELAPNVYAGCLARALNSLGRYEDAKAVLGNAADGEIESSGWFQMAIAREHTGDIPGAIVAYRRCISLDESYDVAWFNFGGMLWNKGDLDAAREVWREAVIRFPDHKLAAKLLSEYAFLF